MADRKYNRYLGFQDDLNIISAFPTTCSDNIV